MDLIFVKQGQYEKGEAAFPLAAGLMRQYLDITGPSACIPEEVTADSMRKTPDGRPYSIAAGAPYISITHSGDIWMCLISDRRCGLDFQYLKERDTLKIVNRFFTEGESDYIEYGESGQFTGSFLRSSEGRSGRFFDIWVRREALGKYEGHGFFGNYPDSAPGGILADSVYFLDSSADDEAEQGRRVYIHEISASMLAGAGVRPVSDFRSAAATESEEPPVVRLIQTES